MNKTLLIVDDETPVLAAYKRMLGQFGLNVDTVDSSVEAYARLGQRSYDALIVDLRLSGFNSEEGLDITAAAKARSPETRTILVTAYGNPDVMDRAFRLGTDYYLEKPVSRETLKKALDRLGVLVL